MKFFKLSLLVLPLFVLADNPILPEDIDSAQETSAQETSAQETLEQVVKEEPAQVTYSDSKIKTTESNYQEEIPRDFVLLSFIFAMLVL
jgi:hypothetical protein